MLWVALAADADATVTIRVVATTPRHGGQHRHRLRYRDRPSAANNTATTISTVDPAADVGVLMVASPEPVLVGGR